MANSKIVYFNETLIDLTNDTITAANLMYGVTAHGADGSVITGTAEISYDAMEEGIILPSGLTEVI